MRSDGTMSENVVYTANSEDGEVLFFELMGIARPKLGGRNMYQRLLIRRVFPVSKIKKETVGDIVEGEKE